MKTELSLALSLLLLLTPSANSIAADPETDILAGHSFHGEAFNEGPRQAAYLMGGMGDVQFPASTQVQLAQRFINQGVAQLHGFWFYEAERSFRQAAVLDSQCAIAYWGMAMANQENRERARKFIEQAEELQASASDREKKYIQAVVRFCQDDDEEGNEISRKDRAQRYTHDLEEIVEENPTDIEAKAFLGVQLWKNTRADLPIVSHVAVDSLLQDVFDVAPNHPAHHYRIHLWDRHKAKRALGSAALCGQSLPGVAHMWHMPGHIFDKLHRYPDAVWQQEASARVDHAHMMRDRVLPDQIHNFAHNNEWLIRNLLKIGRVQDALSLARNMLELPRHPKYNTLAKRGSTKYGRERLLLALSTYRLWPELIELSDTMYLEATEDPKFQIERLRYLGMALALTQQDEKTSQVEAELRRMADDHANSLAKLHKEKDQAKNANADSSDVTDAKKAAANRKRRKKIRDEKIKKLESLKKSVRQALVCVKICRAAAAEKFNAALAEWDDSGMKDKLLKAEWLLGAGQGEASLKLIDEEIDDRPNQLPPLAVKAYAQFTLTGAEAAEPAFEELRILAAQADLDVPLLKRLAPLATELGLTGHWPAEYQVAADVGQRPELKSLGPFRWHPYLAPDFSVQKQDGSELRLKQVVGKPTLIIFYLGFGCLHCVEQLHEFSPRAQQFHDAGIEILAFSTESLDSLGKALDTYSKPLEIPLHVDPQLKAFKAYRCFDDFENQPLHGTFLLDPAGRVLWQDISYEPFMDVDFVLNESQRLLELAGYQGQPTPLKKSNVDESRAAAPKLSE